MILSSPTLLSPIVTVVHHLVLLFVLVYWIIMYTELDIFGLQEPLIHFTGVPSKEWIKATALEKAWLKEKFLNSGFTEEYFQKAWTILGPGYSYNTYVNIGAVPSRHVGRYSAMFQSKDPHLFRIANLPKPSSSTKLPAEYVTGFTDGDGSFSIETDGKGNASFAFKLSQADYNKGLLELFQKYFTVGNLVVENKVTGMYKMVIKTQAGILNYVIPHFDRYPLKSSKRLDYEAFREAFMLYVTSSLPKQEIMARIIEIKESMNNYRSFDDKYAGAIPTVLTAQWIRGFVEAEGCFYCGLGHTKSKTASMAIEHNLEIKQKGHNVRLLASIKEFFDHGKLSPSVNPHNIDDVKEIQRNIILKIGNLNNVFALFDESPLFGDKHQDYLLLKQIYDLKQNKVHLTAEGEYLICKIKAGLNDSRLRWRPILNVWKGAIKPERLKPFVSKRFPEINKMIKEILNNNK